VVSRNEIPIVLLYVGSSVQVFPEFQAYFDALVVGDVVVEVLVDHGICYVDVFGE